MVTFKLEGVEEALRDLDPKLVSRAASAAINKLTKQVKTEGRKAIQEDFNLRVSDIDRKVKIGLARRDDLTGTITVQDTSIGLINFGAKWVRGRTVTTRPRSGELKVKTLKRAGRNQGVTARIRRSGSRTYLPQAFIVRGAVGRSGGLSASNAQVFVRGSSGLIPKRIPSVATLFEREKTLNRIGKLVEAKWSGLFSHELDRLQKGYGK